MQLEPLKHVPSSHTVTYPTNYCLLGFMKLQPLVAEFILSADIAAMHVSCAAQKITGLLAQILVLPVVFVEIVHSFGLNDGPHT